MSTRRAPETTGKIIDLMEALKASRKETEERQAQRESNTKTTPTEDNDATT